MKKITKKKLKMFIKDEKEGIKEYKEHGLYNLAKDEAKHKKFLEQKLKAIK